ncbi:MAG TPA: ROK family protein [Verrucomicrobiae bacterium]
MKPSPGKKFLVIDVGGTNPKIHVTGMQEAIKVPSGPNMTAAQMAAAVKKATTGWKFDVISIGYPGPVKNNHPLREPHNLGGGWVKFDFKKALGKPVRIMNDAAMQALGSHAGGRTLFLGLGTGLGSALVIDGAVLPLELAHLPYKKEKTYEQWLGNAALKKHGKKKWRKQVMVVVDLLRHALLADSVVLGGGNARLIKNFPPGVFPGRNDNAIVGGERLWQTP